VEDSPMYQAKQQLLVLPYSKIKVEFKRGKARDMMQAQNYSKAGNKEVDAIKIQFFLLHKLCRFDEKQMTIEEIEEMDMEDFTALITAFGDFLAPSTDKI